MTHWGPSMLVSLGPRVSHRKALNLLILARGNINLDSKEVHDEDTHILIQASAPGVPMVGSACRRHCAASG